MAFFKKRETAGTVDKRRLPRHIAIIMDGNGRWAEKRGLPRAAGHAAGAETFRKITYYCRDIGIKYFTVYAFSTENWKRSQEEIGAIMGLLEKYLSNNVEKLRADRIRLRFIGDLSPLSEKLRGMCIRSQETSESVDGITVNVCLNYGGQDEIVRAARTFAKACVSGASEPELLTRELFSEYMYTAGIPDPDLIVRPSGEYRLSNFLLWQCAYSEFYFTDVLWPDFDGHELNKAIADYGKRSRRFGGTGGV